MNGIDKSKKLIQESLISSRPKPKNTQNKSALNIVDPESSISLFNDPQTTRQQDQKNILNKSKDVPYMNKIQGATKQNQNIIKTDNSSNISKEIQSVEQKYLFKIQKLENQLRDVQLLKNKNLNLQNQNKLLQDKLDESNLQIQKLNQLVQENIYNNNGQNQNTPRKQTDDQNQQVDIFHLKQELYLLRIQNQQYQKKFTEQQDQDYRDYCQIQLDMLSQFLDNSKQNYDQSSERKSSFSQMPEHSENKDQSNNLSQETKQYKDQINIYKKQIAFFEQQIERITQYQLEPAPSFQIIQQK